MKKKIIFSILIIVSLFLIVGCQKNNTMKQTNIILDGYNLIMSKINNCNDKVKEYYEYDNRKVYLVCLDEVNLKKDNNSLTLKHYLKNNEQDFEKNINKIINYLDEDSVLWDEDTTIYKSSDITIIKCKTIEGNKDIYIGDANLEKKENYCKKG